MCSFGTVQLAQPVLVRVTELQVKIHSYSYLGALPVKFSSLVHILKSLWLSNNSNDVFKKYFWSYIASLHNLHAWNYFLLFALSMVLPESTFFRKETPESDEKANIVWK